MTPDTPRPDEVERQAADELSRLGQEMGLDEDEAGITRGWYPPLSQSYTACWGQDSSSVPAAVAPPPGRVHGKGDIPVSDHDALLARLKADPGTPVFLDSWVLDDGREAFSAALDCIPEGQVHEVPAEHYPRIVGSLKAQGCRVRPDSVLTLVSPWGEE